MPPCLCIIVRELPLGEELDLDLITIVYAQRFFQVDRGYQLENGLGIVGHEREDHAAGKTAGNRAAAHQSVAETLLFGKNLFSQRLFRAFWISGSWTSMLRVPQ